ncbi:MAG: hypothetical protein HQL67_08765, partial [Magnetococcales bacterium]|nr:hypothetical protein [Magnetococcales bacterium]
MAEDPQDPKLTEEQQQEAQVFDDLTVFSNTAAAEDDGDTGSDGSRMGEAEDQSDLANLQSAGITTEDFLPAGVGNAPEQENTSPPTEDPAPNNEVPPIDNPQGSAEFNEPTDVLPDPEFDPIEFPRPSFAQPQAEPIQAFELPELEGENQDPTEPPTEAPTEPPTEAPTEPPTEAPTEPPTEAPTEPPTEAPTEPPTEAPTEPTDVDHRMMVILVEIGVVAPAP